MKKLLLFLIVFVIASTANPSFAQNDLVIFSEQGEKFYVVIDGVKQNAKPETNVKVTGLKQPTVTVKVIFDGGKIADVDQKIYFMWEGEEKTGWEFTYAVVKKGEVYKIKPRSGVQITQAAAPAGQTVVVYSTTPPPAAVPETTTTTISTTTTTGVTPTGDNVNVNMNVGGVGMNVNVNVSDPTMNATSTSSTTITSTTTTSSATTTTGTAATPPPANVYVLPGYNGPNNCNWPMSAADFESAKTSIKAKSFEDSKLTVAKQILGSNCLLSSQVKEIMLVFDFENTRLDFAKFAWGKTFDPGNYYKLNDAFTFESSITDLNKYIEGKK